MGLLGGGSATVNPDNEKCKMHEDRGSFQCKFEDQDDRGDTERAGVVEIQVDENGNIVGSEHEFKGGFKRNEKEQLKGRTAEQLEQELDSGPLDGYSNGGGL